VSVNIWMEPNVAQGVVVMGGLLLIALLLTKTGTLRAMFPKRPPLDGPDD
jgi:hypothetical protein